MTPRRRLRHWLTGIVGMPLACSSQIPIGLGGIDASAGFASTTSAGSAGTTFAGFASTTSAGSAGTTFAGFASTTFAGSAGMSACQATTEVPLDLVVMLDKSLTMNETTSTGETKWSAMTNALKRFGSDPSSADIGLSVGFFAVFDQPDHLSCDVSTYAAMPVEMAPLSAQTQRLAAALDAVKFETRSSAAKTPMHVALNGAVSYARGWASKQPDRKIVVLFVTDGVPNACDGTFDDVVAAASEGAAANPSVTTAIVAVLEAPITTTDGSSAPNAQLANLNRVAAAGLTGSAFLIDIAQSGTETQLYGVLAALRQAHTVTTRCDHGDAAAGRAGGAGTATTAAATCRLPRQTCTLPAECCSQSCCLGICSSGSCPN